MLWHTLNLIFRGLSIYRWNNFPRIEQIATNDHIALSLHVCMLLSSVLKEEKGMDLNMAYIFKKMLFSSFLTYVLSDINSEVKEYIREDDPQILIALENKVFDFLLRMDLPERVKTDIAFIKKERNEPSAQYEMENRLMSFAKLWAAYHEAYYSSKIYANVYDHAIDSIVKKLNDPKFEIFHEYLDLNAEKQNDLEKFLLTIRRLQSSFRWNKMRRIYPVSVLSHLFIVFSLSYFIGILEGKSDEEVTEMMTIALFHDIPEAITGDVVTPTKKAIPGFEEVLSNVESEMINEYLLVNIEKYSFKDRFKSYILTPWESKHGKLVKLADHFSALFEARLEGEKNEEFVDAYKKVKKRLYTFQYPSVDYLLRFGVDYFEDAIDDLS